MMPNLAMTRTPIRRTPISVAALHGQGRAWRLVVAQIGGDGAGEAGGVNVLDARTLDQSQLGTLSSILREHKAAAVIHVLPSGSTICRATTVPDGSADDVVSALGLLAEAELPASLGAHRRAGGILNPGGDSAAPLAALVGWPERDQPGPDPLADLPVRSRVWIPEPVALAELARACGGCRAAVYADRHAGSIAILGASPARSLARILRADATTDATWRTAITDALHQVGAMLAAPMDHLDPGRIDAQTLLLVPMETGGDGALAPAGVQGAKRDPEWMRSFGVALGAVIAYAAAGAMQEPLLSLRPDPSVRSGSLPERAIAWLSTPARAAAVIALSVGLVLLVPLGVAVARSSVLERRAGGTDALRERLDAADREAAFYDLLRARRWPMTKLLADVSGAAPVGIRVESVELSPEQAGPGLLVRGTAPSADAVTEFARNLADTRIVTDIATPSIASEGLGVLFQLQARVVAPLFRAKPAADFAEETLAHRMYGDAASRINYAQVSDEAPSDNFRRPAPRRPAAASAEDAPEAPAGPAAAAPAALTDEAIDALERADVIKEFAARRLAATRAAPGSPERQRLDDEVEKLRRRLGASRGGGS